MCVIAHTSDIYESLYDPLHYVIIVISDLDVAGEHLGGTCEASHPGCEYLLDNYSGWIPSDFNWVCQTLIMQLQSERR